MEERPVVPPAVPPPDPAAEPDGYVVLVGADRIHFLDWGGPPAGGVLLVHGLGRSAWGWTPVARRLRGVVRTVALDLRGHGLSDAPTGGYDPDGFADDLVAVAEGSGLLDGEGRPILVGHGFGAIAAAWAAARLGDRCGGLLLVDGGCTDVAAATGLEPDELLRTIEEPPEVLRSIEAFLADRAAFDPGTWDADQERAARATVVELPAGHVVPVTRPHVLAGTVEAMFAYRPAVTLPAVAAPIGILLAAGGESGRPALDGTLAAIAAAGRPAPTILDLSPAGHDLPRYRPADVAGAILRLAAATMRA
ncbi:MAG: hypothetical protein RL338_845 [Chloroflexota bacterium]